MIALSKKYPGYGFEKHMGYGTGLHQKMMEELGLTPEHRKSFRPVQEIWVRTGTRAEGPKNTEDGKNGQSDSDPDPDSVLKSRDNMTTSEIGSHGEEVVAKYLEADGHEILFRNFKTKQYEIDIISKKSDGIYFTEVKYRRDSDFGAGLDFIDQKKQQKMRLSVKGFMEANPEYADFTPTLAVAAVGKDFKLEEWFELDE